MFKWLLLRLHARKSNHPMKQYLSPNDFAIWIATQDGYYDEIRRRFKWLN